MAWFCNFLAYLWFIMGKKLLFIFSFFSFTLSAQLGKEAWHWYFGNGGGLDFSSGSAVSATGIPGSFFSGGCASVSDEITGQYFFTVGGTHIYNKNHAVMPNGYNIYNGNYNTQNVIVLKPGAKNIFYVFVPDHATLNNHGVTYSIVDMNQNGGLGIVTSVKNKVLTPSPTTEKVAAIRHCNGIDYWVVTHPANSNAFNAYLLNANGLDTIPVVSHVGMTHQYKHSNGTTYFEGMGYLKASPNGKKLVSVIQSDSLPLMEILNFDNSTGAVSNPIQINYPGYFGPWGASFSPDNSKLYCMPYHGTTGSTWDSTFVYQYDLSSGIPSSIIASQTLIYRESPRISLSAMQIAPDGKIYISRYGVDTISIIHNPNASGLACNFQFGGIVTGGYGNWGLPNFIDANYAGIQMNVPDVYQCNTFSSSTLDAGQGYSSYLWSTGATTQTISIAATGQYWVTVTNDQGCQRTDTMNAYVVQPLKIDTVVCDTFKVNKLQPGVQQYNWFDGSNAPVKSITQSGNYYVDVTFPGGCTLRDSLRVGVISSPKVDLGPPVSLCDFKLELNAYYPATTVHWSTGATTASLTVSEPGTYWVTLHDTSGCIGSDTLVIGPPWQLIDLLIPNIVTPNGDDINDEIDFSKFKFSSFTITIYNRWGQPMFSSENPSAIWKPTEDDGTYFYTGKYKLDCGTSSQSKEIKGFITVIR